jgi:hypothetical protein
MQRITAVFAAGAAVLLTSLPAAAQSARTQELTFGGGAHFDFVIPVSGSGRVSVEIQLPATTPVEAILFAAGSHEYAARARGTGSLFLSHTIARKDEAVGDWRLDVVLPSDLADAVGTLKITWPADDRRDDVVTWLNAGPTDPNDLARVADALNQLERRAFDTDGGLVLDAGMAQMVEVVRARLDALSGTPARYVRNDCGQDAVDDTPLVVSARGGALNVNLVEFAAYQQAHWRMGRGADRSYVVAVTVPEPGTSAVGGQSRIYRFMAEDQYHHRVKPVKTTHETGEALLMSEEHAPLSGQLLVAVLEREHVSSGTNLEQIVQGAELFALFRETAGPGSECYLPWLMNVALGRGDGIVGVPRLLTIQRADAGSIAVDRDLRFTQDDADYGVKIRVVAVNPAK